jgi:hypothetical protein
VPLTRALTGLFMPFSSEPFTTLDDIPYSAEMKELLVARARSRATPGDTQDVHLARDPSQRVIAEKYFAHLDELGASRMAESLDFQRQVLGEVLNLWLEMAGVRAPLVPEPLQTCRSARRSRTDRCTCCPAPV